MTIWVYTEQFQQNFLIYMILNFQDTAKNREISGLFSAHQFLLKLCFVQMWRFRLFRDYFFLQAVQNNLYQIADLQHEKQNDKEKSIKIELNINKIMSKKGKIWLYKTLYYGIMTYIIDKKYYKYYTIREGYTCLKQRTR